MAHNWSPDWQNMDSYQLATVGIRPPVEIQPDAPIGHPRRNHAHLSPKLSQPKQPEDVWVLALWPRIQLFCRMLSMVSNSNNLLALGIYLELFSLLNRLEPEGLDCYRSPIHEPTRVNVTKSAIWYGMRTAWVQVKMPGQINTAMICQDFRNFRRSLPGSVCETSFFLTAGSIPSCYQ